MEAIAKLVSTIDGWLWGWPLVILLFGTHLYLTFRLKFIQRHIGKSIKLSVTKDDFATGDVSQFSALTTALAATIGTGNIVGVATAIALGGPGAVFWCWMTGVFGIATKYAESLLAVKYRVKTADGSMAGGPMYVLEYGMKSKTLAYLFAFFGSVAAFGIGNTVQANSISNMMTNQFGTPSWITGIVLAALTCYDIQDNSRNIGINCFQCIYGNGSCRWICRFNYHDVSKVWCCKRSFLQ